jgi:hypothetical protein
MENKPFDSLTPPSDWQPDVTAARRRFDARRQSRSARGRVLLPVALVVSAALAVIMFSADARVAAQHVWQWITLGRIEIVRVNFDDLPDEARSLFAQQLGDTAPPRPVATENEAAAIAGFVPRLPPDGVLPGKPALTVLAPMVHGTTIRIADVELALEKAGVYDVKVPRSWDGAKIQLQIGSAVMAEWTDIALIQADSTSPTLPRRSFARWACRRKQRSDSDSVCTAPRPCSAGSASRTTPRSAM